MRTVFLTALFTLILIPVSYGFSQEFSDTSPSLTVMLDNNAPFVDRDSEGYTVVVGQVVNSDPITFVANVQVSVNFYDDTGAQPLEANIGSTILDVIPPSGSSPYMIRSQSPNPAITQVTVDLEGFDSSHPKQKKLSLQSSQMSYTNDTLYFSGVLNNSGAPISETNIHAAFYDGFDPPRILDVRSITLGNVLSNESVSFDFNEKVNPRAVGFYLFSESDVFYSDFVDLKIPESDTLTKLVTIKNVTVKDDDGNKLSEIPVGSEINIQSESWIQFSADQYSNETPYTYYVQIKRFGEIPYVEFVGKYDGTYATAGTQSQSVDWIPENSGEYFIETFVWDRNNIPIADQGPLALISVK